MMKRLVKIAKTLTVTTPALVNANKTPTIFAPPYTTTTRVVNGMVLNFNDIQNKYYSSSVFRGSDSGNPCHDLYLEVGVHNPASSTLLKELLPLSWSHDPLTTLKLICNLLEDDHQNLFQTALLWLHQNHPKTLACNVQAFTGYDKFNLREYFNILYKLLLPEGDQDHEGIVEDQDYKDILLDDQNFKDIYIYWHEYADYMFTKTAVDLNYKFAKMAVERYERDPDYKFLHDQVCDFFADYLRSDFEKLNNNKSIQQQYRNEFSPALYSSPVPSVTPGWEHSIIAASTLMFVSIARKVFPREDEREEEAAFTQRVVNRLKNEVFKPLSRMPYKFNHCEFVLKFMHDVKAGKYFNDVKAGKSEIKASALLPHQIISSQVYDPSLRDVAELQWKAMVEDLYNKGKWKSCLAVCDVTEYTSEYMKFPEDRLHEVSVPLGLLLSQLSDQEPWKRKVITFTRHQHRRHLSTIQGNDLKCAFMSCSHMDYDSASDGMTTSTFHEVVDLILQQALNANLKPEHMIKKVLVFTKSSPGQHLSDAHCHWPTTYQEIRSKFEEKGYGDVVPHFVFWDLWESDHNKMAMASRKPGVDIFSGFSGNFLKLFLDKEGEIGSDHAQEAAIGGEKYQNLVVVD